MSEAEAAPDEGLLPSGSFVIRPYQPGDEQAINDMFNEVFGQNRDLSHWYWKYRDNPDGSGIVSVAVSPSEVLAAHYGGYPMKLYFLAADDSSAVEIPTFHFGDKMTRKEFRGVGFGKTSLLGRTFNHLKATCLKDVPFGYGFGTHHSLRFGMRFLGYADIEPVPYRTVALENLTRPTAPILVNETCEINERWTDFFRRVAPSYRYLTKRDAAYLTWRYLKRPDRQYFILFTETDGRLSGWSVFHRDGDRIIWGDGLFEADGFESAASILRHLGRSSFAAGARSIECWFPPRPHWWEESLRRLGFRDAPEPNDLHFTGPLFGDADAPRDLRRFFYYTMGDGDLF